MKRFRAGFVIALTTLLLLSISLFSAISTSAATPHKVQDESKHGLRVPPYEAFHDVLHPLEHEALPKKDFRRIRAKSALLVKRGLAIVKLGVPGGTGEDQKEEFAKGLKIFSKALARFKIDARKGTNAQLKTSYSAVHDSFEMLAAMLPRK